MDNRELQELREAVAELLVRVQRLERKMGLESLPPASIGKEERGLLPQTAKGDADRLGRQSFVVNPHTPAGGHSSLENRIGSTWLNRIGIIAVLIGVAYFLKYAFENNLVGPAARVGIGVVAGITVILLGEWFRRRQYRIFSFSLDALALGILYLTLWAASQLYGLIAIELAFAGMLLVTAATAAFALWQDAEVLAMFALIGGFATPALLSVGKNLEIELFSYLVVLDLATLILSFLRAWRRLLLLGIIGTAILYFAWYGEYYSPSQFDSTLTFAIVFFVVFASAPMASARGSYSKRDSVVLFATTLLNALASLCAFALLLEHISPIETSWAMFAIAATYGALAAALQRHEYRAGSILPQLHLSLAVAFVAIAIAFGFESGWITFFWLLEGAVLIGIGFGRNLAFLRWLGLAAIALTIAKLFSYDVWRLERGFRIVSFIALGILLLAVSFVYQQDWLSLSSNRSGRSSSDS